MAPRMAAGGAAAVVAVLLDPVAGAASSSRLGVWREGLNATHFWDCNGAGCDSRTLQPWDERKYIYAPQYAPIDPTFHGGSVYGESLWLTGAASDALSALLGADHGCCGSDADGGGGCGKCLLIRNPTALRSDWTAVVMKKSRCPPWSNGCEAPNVHMDLAVPGYDNLLYSTANTCGNSTREDTYLSRAESGVCGDWYKRGGNTMEACGCNFPADTPEREALRNGCLLFSAWGWTSGNPQLEYQPVRCPAVMEALVQSSFGPTGINRPTKPWWPWAVSIGLGAFVVILCIMICLFQRQAAQQEAEEERLMKDLRKRRHNHRVASSSGSGSESG